MEKVCLNCGQKTGLLRGKNLDGLLCDMCFDSLGGCFMYRLKNGDAVSTHYDCYSKIEGKIKDNAYEDADKEKIKEVFFNAINLKCKKTTGIDLNQYIQEKERKIEKEVRHANYAKSFNEFYEYDVVTIINENHGTVDKERMMNILSEHAQNGWKLHTIYSNELGKNALMIMGFGVNSTACEDVLIFERRVQAYD